MEHVVLTTGCFVEAGKIKSKGQVKVKVKVKKSQEGDLTEWLWLTGKNKVR